MDVFDVTHASMGAQFAVPTTFFVCQSPCCYGQGAGYHLSYHCHSSDPQSGFYTTTAKPGAVTLIQRFGSALKTRPAVSTKRLSMTRNGRVRHELKTSWSISSFLVGRLFSKVRIIKRVTSSTKQFAFPMFSMTFHTRYIPAIMHIVMGVLPFLVFWASGSLHQLILIVTIQADKVSRKSCRLRIFMA